MESMTTDELFELRDLMQQVLCEKMKTKKAVLERRLKELGQPMKYRPTLFDQAKE